jgi:hypothetical protein
MADIGKQLIRKRILRHVRYCKIHPDNTRWRDHRLVSDNQPRGGSTFGLGMSDSLVYVFARMRRSMADLNDYQVRFLNNAGARLDEVVMTAENLSVVSECASEIASEIRAAEFFITLLPPKLTDIGL